MEFQPVTEVKVESLRNKGQILIAMFFKGGGQCYIWLSTKYQELC